jgi:hypothetical protein
MRIEEWGLSISSFPQIYGLFGLKLFNLFFIFRKNYNISVEISMMKFSFRWNRRIQIIISVSTIFFSRDRVCVLVPQKNYGGIELYFRSLIFYPLLKKIRIENTTRSLYNFFINRKKNYLLIIWPYPSSFSSFILIFL